jgi:hypothetical protein
MRAPIVFRGLLFSLAVFQLLILVLALPPQPGALNSHIPRYVVVGMVIAVWALLLVPLIGLWFYQRWARVVFLVILVIAVLISFRRSHIHLGVHLPFLFSTIGLLQHGFYGAVTAMMFLPPIREFFGKRSNQPLELTATVR